jgi:hypothetical protein
MRLHALAAATLALALCAPASAAPGTYRMVDHASFYSLLTRQDHLLDPEAFVRDRSAIATTNATGVGGIAHVAGYRNIDATDDPSTPVFNADGKPFGVSVGQWLGAHAAIAVDPDAATPSLHVTMSGLIPNGVYSLFRVTFGASGGLEGATFAPADGTGNGNTFTAGGTGSADVTFALTAPLTHANAIELIYHSDGHAHALLRGDPGVTMAPQLIWRAR